MTTEKPNETGRGNRKLALSILAYCPRAEELETITKLLNDGSSYEFDVHVVSEREQLIAEFDHYPPDTILLALDFEDDLALATFQEVQSQAVAPVVIIATHGNEAWAVKSLKEGAYGYLPKASLSDQNLAETLIEARDQWLMDQETEELQAELAYMAMYDTLTEVYSRRAILKQIETETARTQRYKRPLSLIMVDIDFFKTVNDNFGHSVGDTVLKQIANALKANTRRSDFVGRFGGEEFLVLLPETPLDKGLLLAEKLRKKISTISIPIGDPPRTITASFGVCEYENNMTIEEFIDLSDRLMYQAKRGGRNQVQPEMASSP